MPRYRAVLFDLDNTLHDRDAAFAFWARRFVRERLGLADGAAAEAVAAVLRLDADCRTDKGAFVSGMVARYPALAGDADRLAASLRAEMLALVALPPESVALLASLDDRGIPWGIVSNGSAAQHGRVRALGLAGRSPCVVVSASVGLRKPDPAIFRLAAARLASTPATTLFVGDDPAADIVGAAEAGMATAWLRRGRAWPAELLPSRPDHAVEGLAEVGRIVLATGG